MRSMETQKRPRGRPRNQDKSVRFAVRMDAGMMTALVAEAKESDRSVAAVIKAGIGRELGRRRNLPLKPGVLASAVAEFSAARGAELDERMRRVFGPLLRDQQPKEED